MSSLAAVRPKAGLGVRELAATDGMLSILLPEGMPTEEALNLGRNNEGFDLDSIDFKVETSVRTDGDQGIRNSGGADGRGAAEVTTGPAVKAVKKLYAARQAEGSARGNKSAKQCQWPAPIWLPDGSLEYSVMPYNKQDIPVRRGIGLAIRFLDRLDMGLGNVEAADVELMNPPHSNRTAEKMCARI